MNNILLIWVCRSCQGSWGVNYVTQSSGNSSPTRHFDRLVYCRTHNMDVQDSVTSIGYEYCLILAHICSHLRYLFNIFEKCYEWYCVLNVLKDIQRRSSWAFYHGFSATKVKSDETHGSHSVGHVYLCENPPSPYKVKCTSLDCVEGGQTRERQTRQWFVYIREWKQLQLSYS